MPFFGFYFSVFDTLWSPSPPLHAPWCLFSHCPLPGYPPTKPGLVTLLHIFSNHTFSQQPSLLDQGSVIEEHVRLSVRFWVSTPLLSMPWLVTIWQEQGQNPTAQEKSAYKSVWSKELQRSPPLHENKILFTELSLALRHTILPCQCLMILGHEGHYREINYMDIIVLPTRTNSIILHCGLKAHLFFFL